MIHQFHMILCCYHETLVSPISAFQTCFFLKVVLFPSYKWIIIPLKLYRYITNIHQCYWLLLDFFSPTYFANELENHPAEKTSVRANYDEPLEWAAQQLQTNSNCWVPGLVNYHNYGKSQYFMGKSTINDHFQ